MDDRRLTAAEERIAELMRTTDEMSAEMARLARELALATRRLQLLMEREATREADAGGSVPLADQRPPHW